MRVNIPTFWAAVLTPWGSLCKGLASSLLALMFLCTSALLDAAWVSSAGLPTAQTSSAHWLTSLKKLLLKVLEKKRLRYQREMGLGL